MMAFRNIFPQDDLPFLTQRKANSPPAANVIPLIVTLPSSFKILGCSFLYCVASFGILTITRPSFLNFHDATHAAANAVTKSFAAHSTGYCTSPLHIAHMARTAVNAVNVGNHNNTNFLFMIFPPSSSKDISFLICIWNIPGRHNKNRRFYQAPGFKYIRCNFFVLWFLTLFSFFVFFFLVIRLLLFHRTEQLSQLLYLWMPL